MMSKKGNGERFEIVVSRDNIIKTYPMKMGENKRKRFSYANGFDEMTQKYFNYWLRVDVK